MTNTPQKKPAEVQKVEESENILEEIVTPTSPGDIPVITRFTTGTSQTDPVFLQSPSFQPSANQISFVQDQGRVTLPQHTQPISTYVSPTQVSGTIPHQLIPPKNPYPDSRAQTGIPPNFNDQNVYVNNQLLQTVVYQNQQILNQNQQMLTTLKELVETLAVNRPYKMIPLGKYSIDKGETLPQFFQRFEIYVQSMYPDSSPEGWGAFLDSHLEGEVKQVYNVLMKSCTGYNQLKNNLLEWFKERLHKVEKSYTSQFYDAKIAVGETIPVYAIRLLGLAEKAFPGNDPKSLKTVRDKFINSLPSQQQQVVRSQLTVCEVARDGNTTLPWSRLVNLVDQTYSQAQVSGKSISSNSADPKVILPSTTQQPEVIDLTYCQTTNIPSQEYYNNNMQFSQPIYESEPVLYGQAMSLPPCHHYQHVPYSCASCPPNVNTVSPISSGTRPPFTYAEKAAQPPQPQPQQQAQRNFRSPRRPQQQQLDRTSPSSQRDGEGQNSRYGSNTRQPPKSPRYSQQNQVVQCTYCKEKGHDVRECPSRPYCQYCGKRGHIFSECYGALNKCIHCDTLGHLVSDCPRRLEKQKSKSNIPCCPYCQGGHLGMTCSQRPNLSGNS